LKASTTSASTSAMALCPEFTSTPAAKSMSITLCKGDSANVQIRYQQLELVHVEDRGCVGAVEFR
jgi:hypothetical protein